MPRPVWKGSLSFGLVSIPIHLYPAERREELSFDLLDKRDMAPVGYRKINKKTGKPVEKEDIVKAYALEEGRYVTVDEEELRRADPEKTQRVDFEAFVKLEEIDPAYFDKPYYAEPAAKADKAYALLREALERTGRAGIGRIVMRTRAYLCAVFPTGPLLTVDLLRFSRELKNAAQLRLPPLALGSLKVSEAELKMAERLIADLAAPWRPATLRDDYRERVLELIRKKAETGVVEAAPLPKEAEGAPPGDIMDLLKRSVAQAHGAKGRAPSRGRGGPMLH
ncbi:MAG: Ku protein [Elusimicrobia bacterium]|nr:Ku protein [Elusimicrobiota bacterium]